MWSCCLFMIIAVVIGRSAYLRGHQRLAQPGRHIDHIVDDARRFVQSISQYAGSRSKQYRDMVFKCPVLMARWAARAVIWKLQGGCFRCTSGATRAA